MTTDITELAQREKFEAWVMTQICISKSTLEGLRTAEGYRNTTLSGTDYNRMWAAWKAAGAELVEALEKAQQVDEELCKLLPPGAEYMDPPDGGSVTPLEQVSRMVADYRQRIADQEESTAQVIQSRDHYKRMIEEGLKQLAESRTVTVKLPDIMPPEAAPAHYWGSGESMAYADGYNKSAADLKTSFAQACSSAGVNVEFE